MRKWIKSTAVAAIGLSMSLGAFAQGAPGTLTIVVPYSAGGASDSIVRSIGQTITRKHQVPVVVDNKPGGGTYIGAQAMLAKPADGNTLFLFGGSSIINPMLLGQSPYDVKKDFALVSGVAANPHVLVVNPRVPADSLKEYVAWAKTKGDATTYSSFGNGSTGHLGFELFKDKEGLKTLHVPYKGGSPALMAVLSGEVDASFADVGTAAPHILAGKVRALGVAGPQRSSALPDVPTFAEAGVSGFYSQSWFAVTAKKDTPKAAIDKLNGYIAEALADAEVKKVLAAQGMEAMVMNPAALGSFVSDESAKFQRIIREAKIKAD